MHRLRAIKVLPTATTVGLVYAVIAAIVAIVLLIAMPLTGRHPRFPIALLFALPIIYGILGFILSALVCLIYNQVATLTGGIEFKLEPTAPANEQARS